jgi:uncharacterized protein YbjT (DUF2867 family)
VSKILVTGATGKIGQRLVPRLTDMGKDVRVFVRDPVKAQKLFGSIDVARGDLAVPASIESALTGVTTVFLLADDPGLEPPIIERLASSAIDRIVKVSAIGRDRDPPDRHVPAETAVVGSRKRFTILRPGAFMQTVREYLPRLIGSDGTFKLPAGTGQTAFIHVDDIAACAAAVLTDRGHDAAYYVLTGPEALGMDAVAALLERALDRRIRFEDLDETAAEAHLQSLGFGPRAHFLVQHYLAVRAGGFAHVSLDVRTLTGGDPKSFAAFVEEDKTAWQPMLGTGAEA